MITYDSECVSNKKHEWMLIKRLDDDSEVYKCKTCGKKAKAGVMAMPFVAKSAMPSAVPIARETIEMWDPIRKCTVVKYKDELMKELHDSLGLNIAKNTMELGC